MTEGVGGEPHPLSVTHHPDPACQARSARPHVGIVVLNYENAQDTVSCLDSLSGLYYNPVDIFVVDNGSSWVCISRLEAAVAVRRGIRLIRNNENLGYAAGNNVGIRTAIDRGATYVLVLNNDVTVEPGFLGPLVEALEADAMAAIAVPRLLDARRNDTTRVRRRPTYSTYYTDFGVILALRRFLRRLQGRDPNLADVAFAGEPRNVEVPNGACMLVRARFLEQIGLLDENTFLYQEEVILAEQLRRVNLRVLLVPDSDVTHLGGRTTRQVPLRSASALWRSQNYYLKNYRGIGIARRGLLLAYNIASYLLLWPMSVTQRVLLRTNRYSGSGH